ncbi:MAG TPA: VCBS repeat-containing protein [Polyangiaceae bacterium]|nr:VCBS repeat-containing protein [Polyangiaceae bacterium]
MRQLHVLSLTVLALSASTLACGSAGLHDSGSALVYQAPQILSAADCDAASVQTGDFNGDKLPDLIVSCSYGKSFTFLNAGAGTFGPANVVGGSKPTVMDINGDGRDDIVETDTPSGLPPVVLLANPDGSFAHYFEASTFPVGCDYSHDLNGDGWDDALCYESGKTTVYSINSDASSTKLFSLSTPDAPKVADINGDGQPDFVYRMGSSILAQLGAGNGQFGEVQVVYTSDGSLRDPWFADIDGDGFVDVVTGTGDTLLLLHNENGSGFKLLQQFAAVPEVGYGFEDASGDGLMDIVLSAGEQLGIMTGHGDGSFDDAVIITGPWMLAGHNFFSDLNGDGKPDLVVPSVSTSVLLRQ